MHMIRIRVIEQPVHSQVCSDPMVLFVLRMIHMDDDVRVNLNSVAVTEQLRLTSYLLVEDVHHVLCMSYTGLFEVIASVRMLVVVEDK